ncbi:MAG: P-loop NTPase [Synergistetes bacterium]|nr:MAG: Carbon monoxide dehydrogenase accessory CooC-like protein [bacterium 42_11]MBC7331575.1 P-loop NTPase [Synergistota bacterium]MDK2871859.1 dehydrogenase maturation factor [bacterium]
MKILIAGKGGVGKTTISALLSLELSERGYNVLALDTDSVPNLAMSLGIPSKEAEGIVPISKDEKLIEEKTGANPGSGWGSLFSLTPKVDDIIERRCVKIKENLKLLVVGSIDQSKEGCLCPAIALAKALLRHILLKERDVIIVDSEAGAEVFGRGLAERFSAMVCVSEPTYKSIKISKKLLEMGKELKIANRVLLINKVQKENLESLNRFSLSPYLMIEFDRNVKKIDEEGKPLTEIPIDSPIRKGISLLAEKLLEAGQ